MNREQVWKHVAEGLRAGFGRLLDVRDVRRVRRVTGEAWVATVVLTAPSGDLHVADVSIDEASGAMTPMLGPDHVIEAVRRAQRASLAPPRQATRSVASTTAARATTTSECSRR